MRGKVVQCTYLKYPTGSHHLAIALHNCVRFGALSKYMLQFVSSLSCIKYALSTLQIQSEKILPQGARSRGWSVFGGYI